MEQTFLVKYIYNNKNFDFFRHTEKRLETILKQERKYITSGYSGIDTKDDQTRIVVYKTDYETTPDKIVYDKTIKEFFEEQGA